VNTDIRVANRQEGSKTGRGQGGYVKQRDDDVHLRNRNAERREPNNVLPGIAPFQMSAVVVWMGAHFVVFVCGQAVMMLRMIVIRIRVGVEQGPCAGDRNQRRYEQQRQDAVHDYESTRLGDSWSKRPAGPRP
jgi:hypothetical protein